MDSDSLEPVIDCRGGTEVGLVIVDLKAPPIDCLPVAVVAVLEVDAGGPIRGRPVILERDFVLESDVRAVVAGVPVRGVEADELTEDGAGLVGDFVGD